MALTLGTYKYTCTYGWRIDATQLLIIDMHIIQNIIEINKM